MRIVSLLSSATEIAAALGFADDLVARSHECDHPPGVGRLPSVTRPTFRTDVPSAEIDRSVKGLVERALAVYQVDADALRALAPDVILTQTQCEVCAVSLADVEAALAEWTGARPRIVALAPATLADVWDDVRRVADALGASVRGAALAARLEARVAELAARAAALPARPTVACIEWIDPLMAVGNWVPEMVALAGGVSVVGEAGRHSPWMEFATLAAADPDAIVVLPCGFDVPRTRAEMGPLLGHPGWPGLRAVRSGRVALADGVRYFNRPGPRLVESLEILAEVLHPEAFDFGHRGDGWEPLDPV